MSLVPLVAGVPLVLGGNLAPILQLVVRDALGVLGITFPTTPVWGIFDQDGNVVVQADNVVSVQYKKDWEISDYPLEPVPGQPASFESYNKVESPFDAKITFSSGGSISNRQDLLDSIAGIAGDTNIYDVHTPEKIYESVNVVHYGFERTAYNGVSLIKVDVWVNEVRQTVQASLSNPQQPQAADPVNNGAAQAQQVSGSQAIFLSQQLQGLQ